MQEVNTKTFRMEEYFAMYLEKLLEPCSLARNQEERHGIRIRKRKGGSGFKTVRREYIGIELNEKHCEKNDRTDRGNMK